MLKQIGALALPPLLFLGLAGGCSKAPDKQTAGNNVAADPTVEAIQEPDTVGTAANEPAGLATDQWVGRWTGPEGLFLDLQPSPDGRPGHYAITNRDTLDRQGDYAGVAQDGVIRFTRDGKPLTIRPGTGDETGFKYLAGKQDCLILIAGQEGYCR